MASALHESGHAFRARTAHLQIGGRGSRLALLADKALIMEPLPSEPNAVGIRLDLEVLQLRAQRKLVSFSFILTRLHVEIACIRVLECIIRTQWASGWTWRPCSCVGNTLVSVSYIL